MKLYFCLLLTVSFLQQTLINTKTKNSKLVGVVEIIRHGARTPMTYMENSAKLYFGSRKAQLTINGLRQHILSGRWLRRRYVHGEVSKLFERDVSKINSREVQVISSPLQRTIFSSTGHINGLFPRAIIRLNFHDRNQIKTNDIPPIKGFKIDPRDGKEITINVISKERDFVFHADKCLSNNSTKTVFQEMKRKKIFNVTREERKYAVEDIMKQYEHFLNDKINKVEKRFKNKGNEIRKNIKKFKQYSKLHLKKLISWLRPFRYHTIFPQLLQPKTVAIMKKQILNRWYEPRLIDSPSLKYSTSYIFNKMHKLFTLKSKNLGRRKMIIFTGHDTNIVNALTNLLSPKYLLSRIKKAPKDRKDYKFLVPPLASNLLFELYKKNLKNEFYVKILYNGEYINENFIKKLRVKKNKINFFDFMRLINSRILPDTKQLKCGFKFK